MKTIAIALLLTTAAGAEAGGFRPWADPAAGAPSAHNARVRDPDAHRLGFQPFAETQRRVRDARGSANPRIAEEFRMGIGFQPRNI